MDQIRIRRPDDFHAHLRQGAMLTSVAPYTSRDFARALVMPNTVPPVADAADAARYEAEIAAVTSDFTPLMTIKITPGTSADTIRTAREAGILAGKLYPRGVTTNSADGVRDFDQLMPTFEAMAAVGMVLCVHGEDPDAFCLDREETFLNRTLNRLIANVPGLRVVLEHISTAAAVDVVRASAADGRADVAATITVHHLMLTLHDVVGELLEPHHFCKPLPKRPDDRQALVAAATGGEPHFFLGTDSAPHPVADKERAGGCAGTFTAPVALAALAQLFADLGRLDNLEPFTSVNGARFYGLGLSEGQVTIVKQAWKVPAEYGGVVPFLAGRTIGWKVERDPAHVARFGP
jgi:dihydroorotase